MGKIIYYSNPYLNIFPFKYALTSLLVFYSRSLFIKFYIEFEIVTVSSFNVLTYFSNSDLDPKIFYILSLPCFLYFIFPANIGLSPNLNPNLPKLFASFACPLLTKSMFTELPRIR